LRGRVEDGRSGGGLCDGYDVVKQFAASGEPIRGDRTINEAEAATVRRIFRDYVAGKSSRTIAWELNRDRIPGPFGKDWGPSTIHGNPKRGTGVLNNELYLGRLVWNRLRYLKDPSTGKRVSRPNPEADWVIQDVPELRIIDTTLWDAAKARQQSMAQGPAEPTENPLLDRRRPKYLFAGLVKCGGGGYSMISKDLLGCAAARNKGTCDNRLNIRRDSLEASVLSGLRTHLMEPALFKEFCEEFTREVNRLRIAGGAGLARACKPRRHGLKRPNSYAAWSTRSRSCRRTALCRSCFTFVSTMTRVPSSTGSSRNCTTKLAPPRPLGSLPGAHSSDGEAGKPCRRTHRRPALPAGMA
jgi:site-specific DNA recombinase